MRNEKLHAAVARSTLSESKCTKQKFRCVKIARVCRAKHTFKSKCEKNCTPSGHFWKFRCRKWHETVARSTFVSRNVKKLTVSGHFWKVGCQKMARRCGAKHIYKSKCTKHMCFGPLLEVPMSKRCPTEESVRQLVN